MKYSILVLSVNKSKFEKLSGTPSWNLLVNDLRFPITFLFCGLKALGISAVLNKADRAWCLGQKFQVRLESSYSKNYYVQKRLRTKLEFQALLSYKKHKNRVILEQNYVTISQLWLHLEHNISANQI